MKLAYRFTLSMRRVYKLALGIFIGWLVGSAIFDCIDGKIPWSVPLAVAFVTCLSAWLAYYAGREDQKAKGNDPN